MTRKMVLMFSSILWNAILSCSPCLAGQTASLFTKAVFENGMSIQNLTSHNVRGCLGKCKDTCSAIKYNPSTTECRLFAHVLLKWPIQASVDMDEKMYVKVRFK